MTLDSALLYRPTESLIHPTKRRFFPFDIPNHHHQLRHYISTADPDRIYVVSDRTVFSIHISSRRVEIVALIPFEPKCLTAGYGWIGVGGADNGECAFIKLAERGMRVHGGTSGLRRPSDVDSALPIDLEAVTRASSPWVSDEVSGLPSRAARRLLPEVQLHKFGGSIVNSVTIHRLPGDDKDIAEEDIVVLSNNDRTVTVYSLSRAKVLRVIPHHACMNYAIVSPDSSVLAAVGDENRAYFYEVARNSETTVSTETGERLNGWDWNLLRCIEMDIGTQPDDKCCFTIAFSPSSHLCAIGSQSGVITVFDVETIRESPSESLQVNPIVAVFRSSRFGFDVGAVRCMSFSPEPWDLLVWIEDHGRAGIADARQSFLRRQILKLDLNDPHLQKVSMEPISDGPGSANFEIRTFGEPPCEWDTSQRSILDAIESLSDDHVGEGTDRSSLRENLIQNLTERELIMEFLNTARWTSRAEDSLTGRPARGNLQTRLLPQGSTEVTSRASRPTLPLHYGAIQDFLENSSGTTSDNISSRAADPNMNDPDLVMGDQSQETMNRARAAIEPTVPTVSVLEALSRQRLQRSSSTPRRSERPDATPESRYDRLLNSELRTNVAAERLRRQRQLANEVHNRAGQWEQRYRQQAMGFEQARSSRWIRNVVNQLPDRSLGHAHRDHESGGTAGVGWGADGRTLYVGTVDGIFEFQVNVHDRKTFPDFSYR